MDPNQTLPVLKAVRFRLYDVLSRSLQRSVLLNKEKIRFACDTSDLHFIGGFSQTVDLSPTLFLERLKEVDGFFWLRFRKQTNQETRSMFAVTLRPRHQTPHLLRLQDLQLLNTEVRQCYYDAVTDFIVNDIHYRKVDVVVLVPALPPPTRRKKRSSQSPKPVTMKVLPPPPPPTTRPHLKRKKRPTWKLLE